MKNKTILLYLAGVFSISSFILSIFVLLQNNPEPESPDGSSVPESPDGSSVPVPYSPVSDITIINVKDKQDGDNNIVFSMNLTPISYLYIGEDIGKAYIVIPLDSLKHGKYVINCISKNNPARQKEIVLFFGEEAAVHIDKTEFSSIILHKNQDSSCEILHYDDIEKIPTLATVPQGVPELDLLIILFSKKSLVGYSINDPSWKISTVEIKDAMNEIGKWSESVVYTLSSFNPDEKTIYNTKTFRALIEIENTSI